MAAWRCAGGLHDRPAQSGWTPAAHKWALIGFRKAAPTLSRRWQPAPLLSWRPAHSGSSALPGPAQGGPGKPDLLQMALDSHGVSRDAFESGVQELLLLLPSLRPRFARLSPQILVGLAQDPARVAGKLAELKSLFPTADVYRIVNRRPSLLLDAEFRHLQAAASKLEAIFPSTDIGHMVEQQPLLLVEDIDEAIRELQRWQVPFCPMPTARPGAHR